MKLVMYGMVILCASFLVALNIPFHNESIKKEYYHYEDSITYHLMDSLKNEMNNSVIKNNDIHKKMDSLRKLNVFLKEYLKNNK